VIRVVTKQDVDAASKEIESAPRVAIDTEFHAERRYYPKLYLVQVHVPDGTTWLFDPLVPGLLEHAAPALRAVPWLVHGSAYDLPLLHGALGGLTGSLFDTQLAAGLVEAAWPSRLGVLCERWIDTRIPKAATLTDWSRRPLHDAQIRYAADDVLVLPALADALTRALNERGRGALSDAAHAEALAHGAAQPPVDRAWTEIPGAANLTPAGAAVLQELAEWRERVARDADQPATALISNGILLDLARNTPTTANDLRANRRFPKKLIDSWGPDLLECIHAARRRPEWGHPRFPFTHSAAGRRLAFVECAAAAAGTAGQFGWKLAAPPHVREALALLEAPTRADVTAACATPPCATGWRDDLIGDELAAALTGARHLTLVDGEVRLT
jgi:ribonuclease D